MTTETTDTGDLNPSRRRRVPPATGPQTRDLYRAMEPNLGINALGFPNLPDENASREQIAIMWAGLGEKTQQELWQVLDDDQRASIIDAFNTIDGLTDVGAHQPDQAQTPTENTVSEIDVPLMDAAVDTAPDAQTSTQAGTETSVDADWYDQGIATGAAAGATSDAFELSDFAHELGDDLGGLDDGTDAGMDADGAGQ